MTQRHDIRANPLKWVGVDARCEGVYAVELTLTPTAAASTDLTVDVPVGARLLTARNWTTTAYTGNTVELSLGSSAGGSELVAATDIKAKGEDALDWADTAADVLMNYTVGTVYVRIAQTATETAVGAGKLIIWFKPAPE